MTQQELIARLQSIVTEAGSQRKAAVVLGISQPYLGELLRGTRKPGPKVLERMGLRKEYTFKEDSNG